MDVSDVFSKRKRSEIMSRIRSRGNKDTELVLATMLRRNCITGWRRHYPIPGKPDFVFTKVRLAVFVDGCFWHGCPLHYRRPASNIGFWRRKYAGNRSRDKKVTAKLRRKGWKVMRIWEHSLKRPKRTLARIQWILESSII